MTHSAADAKVLGADDEFHVTDDPVDLTQYSFESWIAFGFFWLLALNIFYQFFTRYVLNDSAAWTEEIARYLLICVVFVGMAAAVRTNTHIHVDVFYRFMPAWFTRILSTLVDIIRIVFFAVATVLTWQMMQKMGSYKMTIIDLPMNLVYGVCMFGFACAAVRSVQVAIRHWKQGYSVLERPETAITETI
ncbi:MAG: TRAP transporter small permease [Betaproteobacteria bacterium]|nr:TRAP transporter small permease [Betaproteobacteria bacterium]MBK9606563.1 TRAP transporter small permease [Betaproteobacteria bacterium]